MDPLDRPSLNSLIAESVQKLNDAENALRHVILFAFDPALNHSFIEADALIRRAISILMKTLPNRER